MNVVKDTLELVLSILLFGTALWQLIFANDVTFEGIKNLPSTETVYFETTNKSPEHFEWSGSQVIAFLKEADLTETPVQVGSVVFERDKQVEELWKYINPNSDFIMTPNVTESGNLKSIKFETKGGK